MKNSTHFDQQDIGYLLTAYADAQLAPEGVMWVEEQLDRNANLRAKLKEIRELQAGLRAAFAGNAPDYQLDLPRRDALLDAAAHGPKNKIRFPAPMWIGLAASLMAVAYVGTISIGSLASPRAGNMLAYSDSADNELPPMRITVTSAAEEPDAAYFEKNYEGRTKGAKEDLAIVDEKRRTNRGPMPATEDVISEIAPSDPFAPMPQSNSTRERQPVKKPKAQSEPSPANDLAPDASMPPTTTALVPPGASAPTAPRPVTSMPKAPMNSPVGNSNGQAFGGAEKKKSEEYTRRTKEARRELAENYKSNDTKSELKPAESGKSVSHLYRDLDGKDLNTSSLRSLELADKLSKDEGRGIPGGARNVADQNELLAKEMSALRKDQQQQNQQGEAELKEGITNGGFPGPELSIPESGTDQGQVSQRGGEKDYLAGKSKSDRQSEMRFKQNEAKPVDEIEVVAEESKGLSRDRSVTGEDALNNAERQAAVAHAERDASGSFLALVSGDSFDSSWKEKEANGRYNFDGDKNGREEELAVLNKSSEEQLAKLKDSATNERAGQKRVGNDAEEKQLAQAGPQLQNTMSWFANSSQIDQNQSLDSLLAVGNYQIAGDPNSLLVMMSDSRVAIQATPAAQQALQQSRTNGIALKVTNEANASGIIRVARSAQLQAQFTGGLVQLDVAQRPLDPTDYQGYDAATFKKLFGTSPMQAIAVDPIQTVAIDADTASYNYAKARVAAGEPVDASTIKPEHFINAMPMDYPPAQGPEAFSLFAEAGPSPFARTQTTWGARTALVTIGAVAKPAAADERRPLSLTLAIDCSGSMAQPGGLDRIQLGLQTLIQNLRADDNVSVVAFGDQARVVLPATPGNDPTILQQTIQNLTTGGATNAAEGLALAYQLAAETAKPGVESRVLLATDGGTVAGADDLLRRVMAFKDRGITLVVVGCGQTYHAGPLQELTTKGDGQHFYVGNDEEATQLFSTSLLPDRLGVLAKDAKLQVTWNPQRISHARLIGYDQRRLAAKDFRDNTVDAGELSQDTQVTALFEVLLVDGGTGPLGNAAVRYYDTRRESVREISCPLPGSILATQPSDRLRLVACAAATAEWLQRGWWSNVHLITPEEIRAQLDKCPQPIAQELKLMVNP